MLSGYFSSMLRLYNKSHVQAFVVQREQEQRMYFAAHNLNTTQWNGLSWNLR